MIRLEEAFREIGAKACTLVKIYYDSDTTATPVYCGKVNHVTKSHKRMFVKAIKADEKTHTVLFLLESGNIIGVVSNNKTAELFADARYV